MNKKDEIKLEVLSQIDDDIIEKQTKKRFALMTGKPRKNRGKMIPILSSAAALVLVCGILLVMLFPLLGKQVPVYEGMTISNTAPTAKLAVDLDRLPTSLSLADTSYATVLSSETVGAADNRLIEAPEVVKPDRSLYYAKKNEDIYVTVHIHNPENFEILSFTLNGFKYQSYMFEDGSDSTQLILKINVGDAEGMVDYTIDAIKYVDGTQIKDVRMDGERTVRVAVYPENQPTADVSNVVVTETELRFDLLVRDEKSLIADSEGEVYVALYGEDTLVSKQTVKLGEKNEIVFSNLTPGLEYRYEVVANYDALDGRGYGAYVLTAKSFKANSHVTVKNVSVVESTVSFEVDGLSYVTVQKVELLYNGVSVAEGDASTRRFDGIFAGEYTISVTYSYTNNGAEQTGYAFYHNVKITTMGRLDRIVRDAIVTKAYSGDMQVYNETTSDYRAHLGVDLKPGGTDMGVYAAISGKIVALNPSSGVVTIESDNGIVLHYRSMDTILVSEAQTVVAGQQIGTVGRTYALERAEDAHLCLEMTINGAVVDPSEYFE